MKKLSLVLLTLFASTLAHAYTNCCYQVNRANSVTLTVGSGYYLFAEKRHMENTGVPFIALGYNFTHEWGVEALLGTFTTSLKNPPPGSKQVRGTLFAVDGVYHFAPYRKFQPFVLAGVGILGMNPNGNDANNEGNINAGVGAQYFINDIIAFRAEVRDFYTMVGGKNDVYIDGGVTFFLDWC